VRTAYRVNAKGPTQTYSWVKHAAGNTIKHPHIDRERRPEARGHVHEAKGQQGVPRLAGGVGIEGGLGANVGHEEEHEGAAQLAEDDDDEVARRVGEHVLPVAALSVSVGADVEDAAELVDGRHGCEWDGGPDDE
jgi:hypothetical protein